MTGDLSSDNPDLLRGVATLSGTASRHGEEEIATCKKLSLWPESEPLQRRDRQRAHQRDSLSTPAARHNLGIGPEREPTLPRPLSVLSQP